VKSGRVDLKTTEEDCNRFVAGSGSKFLAKFNNNKNTTIMPKVKTITVYNFSELSDDAKENAIENLSDINVDYDWWESIYEELKSIGFECKGFEIWRYCKLSPTESYRTIAKKILEQHGQSCGTYTLAFQFIEAQQNLGYKLDRLLNMYHSGKYQEHREQWLTEKIDDLGDQITGLEEEFHNDMENEYRFTLKKEWEYLTSEKAIIETIESNDYEFDKNGNLV